LISGRGKNGDPSFHLSIHEGRDIPLMNIMGGVKLDGGTKTTIVLNPGVNFTNILSAVFTLEDPQSVKKYI
jgi:hypothetical protein